MELGEFPSKEIQQLDREGLFHVDLHVSIRDWGRLETKLHNIVTTC